MSIRLEMLQVARLASKLLGDSTELVTKFLHAQQNGDGGFKGRTGTSDLYYTVFGLDALAALQQPIPTETVRCYLDSFGDGANLDFVHLCGLIRCWSAVAFAEGSGATKESPAQRSVTGTSSQSLLTSAARKRMLERFAQFRALDGGYNPVAGSEHGTAYGAFLALGAHQDLHVEVPEAMELVRSLKFLETSDGAWTNEVTPHSALRTPHAIGSTNATAAAVTVLRNLGMPINPSVGHWLLARAHPQGGFLAVPNAPIPDLLSTATALHALAGMEASVADLHERCLDFIDSLWTNEGSFHGNWTDDHLDCEYTFYGLLALGHLSV